MAEVEVWTSGFWFSQNPQSPHKMNRYCSHDVTLHMCIAKISVLLNYKVCNRMIYTLL